MIDGYLTPGSFSFVLLLIFTVLFIIQLFYYGFFFLRFVRCREMNETVSTAGVSVVICARDEYNGLRDNLPLILCQDYPLFEVVVVNHASNDETSVLLSQIAEQHPHLKVVEIKENLNFFDGKKFPLSIGIKSATYDIVLLTDADCSPAGTKWISCMAKGFTNKKEIVLGYGAYQDTGSFLNRLIRFDTIHIALQYLSYALAGIPYMGVGRNMAYRKSLFYEKKGFTSHYTINSGDDDLFINHAATRNNTRVVIDPESFTISRPKTTFREWWIQKKRHLSTGRYYQLSHKLLLGLYSLSLVFFYACFAILLSLNYTIYFVLALFTIRLAVQLVIFHKTLTRLEEKGIWLLIPFFEIMLVFMNIILFASHAVSKETKWK